LIRVGVVGTGPAGLMAADVLASKGVPVTLFEKRKGIGRKLLIAGSSGLNITNDLPLDEFVSHYTGSAGLWKRLIGRFTPADWIRFIEEMGIPTFKGTSGRYFVEDMKASRFLKAWRERLESQGVEFVLGREVSDFDFGKSGVNLRLDDGSERDFSAVCFALGGGSHEPQETPLRWPVIFRKKGLGFSEFVPSNVGFQVAWTEEFLKEAEGHPIKGVVLSSPRGKRQGEVVITRYGMEGTPVYFVGQTGRVTLDLKPDLTVEQIASRLAAVRENLSNIRRVKKQLKLDPAALALLFHFSPVEAVQGGDQLRISKIIKAFPLEFLDPRPLSESISSSGGLVTEELDENMMLRKCPGVFAAGEMLDWDVPTGGFLIQGCAAMGRAAGEGILRNFSEKP
jgi:uncharacterized flavoprotein (TIGR03862 family)